MRTRMRYLIASVVRGHGYHIALPFVGRPLNHLFTELSHRDIEILPVGIGDSLVCKRIRYRNLRPFLETRSLNELITPRLDVGELADVNTAPLSRVSIDEDCNIGNR